MACAVPSSLGTVGLCGQQGAEGSPGTHGYGWLSEVDICTSQSGGDVLCVRLGKVSLLFPFLRSLLVNLLFLGLQFSSVKHTTSQG